MPILMRKLAAHSLFDDEILDEGIEDSRAKPKSATEHRKAGQAIGSGAKGEYRQLICIGLH